MKPVIIVQARMGSARLPGKTMMDMGGRPMLDYVIQGLLTAFAVDDLVIVTSDSAENDSIRAYGQQTGIFVFSGEELNVASRYYEVLQQRSETDCMFRICADTPMYDASMLKSGLEIMEKEDLDWVSSMPNKGYPMGCNLELIKKKTFLEGYRVFQKPEQFEHVMPYFYENAATYSYKLIACERDGYAYEKYKFSVDTATDFDYVNRALKKMNYEPWKYTLNEKLDILDNLNTPCL